MLRPISSTNNTPRAPAALPDWVRLAQNSLKRMSTLAAAKKPAYPKSGSFDMVIKAGQKGVLPISVDWKANGSAHNGVQRIKGYVRYLVRGEVVSFALDQNNSFIKNGKIHFASPVLKRSFVFETNVNTQQKKFDAIRTAVLAIQANKRKPAPTVKIQNKTVNILAGKLYGTLLSFGVDDIKYGRSKFAQKIRSWLTIALSPKRAGWGTAAAVSSALHELGLNARRGHAFKVQLRPMEKAELPRKMAGGSAVLPLLVANLADLRNIMDAPMNRFNTHAANIYWRMREAGQRPTAQQVWDRMVQEGHTAGYVAADLAGALGARGVFTVEGLDIGQILQLMQNIMALWDGIANVRSTAARESHIQIFRIHLINLIGPGANRNAVDAVVNAVVRAPFGNNNLPINHIRGMIALEARRNWATPGDLAYGLSFIGDKARRD